MITKIDIVKYFQRHRDGTTDVVSGGIVEITKELAEKVNEIVDFINNKNFPKLPDGSPCYRDNE